MRQALRMLARDWRAGELRVLAAALVVAVASITSVAAYVSHWNGVPPNRVNGAPRGPSGRSATSRA